MNVKVGVTTNTTHCTANVPESESRCASMQYNQLTVALRSGPGNAQPERLWIPAENPKADSQSDALKICRSWIAERPRYMMILIQVESLNRDENLVYETGSGTANVV